MKFRCCSTCHLVVRVHNAGQSPEYFSKKNTIFNEHPVVKKIDRYAAPRRQALLDGRGSGLGGREKGEMGWEGYGLATRLRLISISR